ncbi:hypothetical protein CYMTET_12564 [Cymbomonas tetramitiformis]|uniref:Uncharacterized protein n=1 Tax=Cymbomonas tetramitiformis TaxID=36881 RepID=A0AAE0GKA2_9CHLO|nr:hypothetical protein CYMTET_12564 [Cymbomonas tetramitiformis]
MLEEIARRILAAGAVQRNSYDSAAPAVYADPLLEMFVMIGARSTKALTIFEVARRVVMTLMTTTMYTSQFGLDVLRDSPRDFATAAFIGACSSANIEVIIALRDRYRLSTRPELTDFAANRHAHSDFDFVRRAAEMLIAADLNFAETTSTLRFLWDLTLAAEATGECPSSRAKRNRRRAARLARKMIFRGALFFADEAPDRGGLGDTLLTSTLLSSASPSVILWYLTNLRVPLRWGDHCDLLRNSNLVFGDRSDELVDELWRRLVVVDDVADGDRRTERFRDVIDSMPNMTTLNRFLRSWMRLNNLEKLSDTESAVSLNRLRDLILSPSERFSFCYLDTAGAHEYGFFEGEAFSEFRQLFDLLAAARILGIERASHSAFANRLRHPYTLQIAETIPLGGILEKLAGTVRGARSGKYLLLIAPELAEFLRTHRTRSTNLSDRYHRNLSALQSIDKSNVPSFPVRNAENPTANREYAFFDTYVYQQYLEALFEFTDRVHDEVVGRIGFWDILESGACVTAARLLNTSRVTVPPRGLNKKLFDLCLRTLLPMALVSGSYVQRWSVKDVLIARALRRDRESEALAAETASERNSFHSESFVLNVRQLPADIREWNGAVLKVYSGFALNQRN